MPDRAPDIPADALASYLSGEQDDQEWALLDNLQADEARDIAKLAIRMLRSTDSTKSPEPWPLTEGVTCVTCPTCGFTFSAEHVEPDEQYDCPACMVQRCLYVTCNICGKKKWAETPERAIHIMAFHLDRRHRGWTDEGRQRDDG